LIFGEKVIFRERFRVIIYFLNQEFSNDGKRSGIFHIFSHFRSQMTQTTPRKRLKIAPALDSSQSWFALDYGVTAINRSMSRVQIAEGVPGFAWLDATSDAWIIYVRGAIGADQWTFNAFWALREHVARTPNPYNPNQVVKRIQTTYGSSYKFGAQTSEQIGGDDEGEWPAPVRDAVADARARCSLANKVMVHVNWYCADAQIAPHADDEAIVLAGSPIFSYTLVRDSPPRAFQIYDKGEFLAHKQKCAAHAEYALEDGSLLVMGGSMQFDYVHGVAKAKPRKAYLESRRINITVRFLA
jgi:alkylated DNA repair dioxygenase AlkB